MTRSTALCRNYFVGGLVVVRDVLCLFIRWQRNHIEVWIGREYILTTFVLMSTEISVPTRVRPSTVIMQTFSKVKKHGSVSFLVLRISFNFGMPLTN